MGWCQVATALTQRVLFCCLCGIVVASGDIMPAGAQAGSCAGAQEQTMASKCAVSLAPHAHPRSSSCKDVCRPRTPRYAAAELVLTTAMAISN
jgi:hypothetical protein